VTAGGANASRAITFAPSASMDIFAPLRGNNDRTRPSPDTPAGIPASEKPGTNAPWLATAITTVEAVQTTRQWMSVAVSPAAGALCLMALVKSSLTVSAIGIESASVSAKRCGARPVT
jgi:hypothetical protein